MSEVKIGEHDSFEAALKRFNRKIQQDEVGVTAPPPL
jgi:ribosomal protein S21